MSGIYAGWWAALPAPPVTASPSSLTSHPPLKQNYPAGYATYDYDSLLELPDVAAAAAEHLASNAASRAATPTATDAEQAAAEAAEAIAAAPYVQGYQPVPEAEMAEAQLAPAEQTTEAAAAPPGAFPHSPTPERGSLPPSPRERPLSAAAADLAAAAEEDGAAPPEGYEAGDPTLGQVFASYLRPQLAHVTQHVTQSLKAAAGAAAAAAQQQLTAAQMQLASHGGAAGVAAASSEEAAAAAGGLLGAVGGRKHRAGKLQKALPWEQAGSEDGEGGGIAASSTAAASASAAESAANGVQSAVPAAEEAVAAALPTLAEYAAATAEAAAATAAGGEWGYETPAGGVSPSRLLPPGTGASPVEEDEGSTADMLSPGGCREGSGWARCGVGKGERKKGY